MYTRAFVLLTISIRSTFPLSSSSRRKSENVTSRASDGERCSDAYSVTAASAAIAACACIPPNIPSGSPSPSSSRRRRPPPPEPPPDEPPPEPDALAEPLSDEPDASDALPEPASDASPASSLPASSARGAFGRCL